MRFRKSFFQVVLFIASLNAATDPRATLLTPSATVLPGTVVTFSWTPGSGSDGYWLDVGPVQGSGAYWASFVSTQSTTATGLPCFGGPAFVRLWTRTAGSWQPPIDYSYTQAASCANGRAQMVSPIAQSTISGTTATFTWFSGGALASQYWLDVGTRLSLGDIASGATNALTRTVSNLPYNGQPLYVRLWTMTNGVWQPPLDYVYSTTTDPRATLVVPMLNTPIKGSTVQFFWNGSVFAYSYWLDVGTSLGQGDISAGSTTLNSRTVNNLPNDGKPIYVRLWTFGLNGWEPPFDYVYPTIIETRAQLTSPLANSRLVGTVGTFSWTTGAAGTDGYWLDVGTTGGGGNLFAGLLTTTTKTLSNLPNGGGYPLFVRLWTRVNGVWQAPLDYQFTN